MPVKELETFIFISIFLSIFANFVVWFWLFISVIRRFQKERILKLAKSVSFWVNKKWTVTENEALEKWAMSGRSDFYYFFLRILIDSKNQNVWPGLASCYSRKNYLKKIVSHEIKINPQGSLFQGSQGLNFILFLQGFRITIGFHGHGEVELYNAPSSSVITTSYPQYSVYFYMIDFFLPTISASLRNLAPSSNYVIAQSLRHTQLKKFLSCSFIRVTLYFNRISFIMSISSLIS